jgi:hypothetical protein
VIAYRPLLDPLAKFPSPRLAGSTGGTRLILRVPSVGDVGFGLKADMHKKYSTFSGSPPFWPHF